MTDRIQTVKQVYLAFGEGDSARLQELLGDTHWIEAAGMPYGGTYRGFAEVAAAVVGPLASDIPNLAAKPDEIIAVGEDRVLALGTYRGTGSAGDLASPFAHVWTVREGRITNFVQYADTHLFRQATGA
jgi:ketosteroid isomerase-like protein